MSDTENTTSPDAEVETTAPVNAEAGEQPSDDGGDGSKRAILADLMKERERRREMEARLKQIEDANLSELERAQREANEARETLATIQRENDRNRVALEKGVPSDLIEFITGDTAEDMAAKADLLLSRLGSNPSTPKPDRTQGASGKEPRKTTADQFADFFNANIES